MRDLICAVREWHSSPSALCLRLLLGVAVAVALRDTHVWEWQGLQIGGAESAQLAPANAIYALARLGSATARGLDHRCDERAGRAWPCRHGRSAGLHRRRSPWKRRLPNRRRSSWRYDDDADRPISVTLRLSPKSRAQLRDMAKALDVLLGQITSDAIEQYFKREFPNSVPTRREPKASGTEDLG